MRELLFVVLLVASTWSTTLAQRTDDTLSNGLTVKKFSGTGSIETGSGNYNAKKNSATVSVESISITCHLLCVDSTRRGIVRGTIVDPLEPDFELYTSKIVLLRESFLPTGTTALTRTLKEILSADPKAIIILTESDAGVNSVAGLSATGIPIVTVAMKESTEILFATKNRRQVSLAIK